MIEIKDLKKGDKLIYFSIMKRYGYEVGINYDFGIEIEKVLKTKIKAKNGMEFKIENGIVNELFHMVERDNIISEIKLYYKKQFYKDEEMTNMPRLKKVALKEFLDENWDDKEKKWKKL